MGRRGTKPRSIESQIREGDPRKHGKHKLEQELAAQVKAAPGLPPCPRHLKGRARTVWGFWAEELQAMKLDKRPDGPMLEGACVAYDRAVDADLILQAQGLIVEEKYIDDDGNAIVLKVKKHPAVDISNRSWLTVKAFCVEFGLTPVSRIRLRSERTPEDDADDLAKLLSAPRPTLGTDLVQ